MVDRLKFKKYLVQGGDWGSLVVTNVGRMYPENLYGVHVNMMFMFPGRDFKSTAMMILGSIAPSWVFSSPEFASFNMKRSFVEFIKESGYMHIQATKPDTVGVGLNDSPIGLLAYILEKFSGWTNPLFKSLDDGGLERKFTKDELITIIMIYWLNGNIVSSQRYYKEYFGSPEAMKFAEQYVSAPVGYAHFPHDLGGDAGMPPEIVSVAYNLTHYYRHKDGGHFAAFEVPQYLAKDFITFAKKVVP
uniref:Epoxide hydrolase n=1 Tax=Acrobeloides nanus TaxID=290746 RepID=A0A914CS32_9BILA